MRTYTQRRSPSTVITCGRLMLTTNGLAGWPARKPDQTAVANMATTAIAITATPIQPTIFKGAPIA